MGYQCVSLPSLSSAHDRNISPVAPSLIKNKLAVGVPASDQFPLVSYNALTFDNPSDFTQAPSPRYWLLCMFTCHALCVRATEISHCCIGPGILMMLCYSFTDLGMNSGFIITGMALMGTSVSTTLADFSTRSPQRELQPPQLVQQLHFQGRR